MEKDTVGGNYLICKLKDRKGVTLLELLIVSALIIVVLLPISMFFTGNLNHFYRENDRQNAQREAGRIMEQLTARVMEANRYSADGGNYKFITDNNEEWIFNYKGNRLEYNPDKTEADNMVELSQNVSGFKITAIKKNSKDIGVEIELSVTHRRESYTLLNKVYFRNF